MNQALADCGIDPKSGLARPKNWKAATARSTKGPVSVLGDDLKKKIHELPAEVLKVSPGTGSAATYVRSAATKEDLELLERAHKLMTFQPHKLADNGLHGSGLQSSGLYGGDATTVGGSPSKYGYGGGYSAFGSSGGGYDRFGGSSFAAYTGTAHAGFSDVCTACPFPSRPPIELLL